MSGRLIITTKKTYCPWNPANVERVLRDERLERERIERQQQQEQQKSAEEEEWRRRHHNGEETQQQQDEHVNLFPEAREAEIRLAQKGGLIVANDNNDTEEKRHNGILPVPLGGDESINRKRGNVPFYLQTSSSSTTREDRQYNNDISYLGIRGHGTRAAATTSSDEITNRIMRDQFASREEYRKRKNDPMSRFYVDDNDNDVDNIYADREGRMSGASHDVQLKSNGQVDGEDISEGVNNYCSMERHEQEDEQKKRSLSPRRKRKSSSTTQNEGKNDESSEISSASSSSESSSSSSCRDRERRRRHRKEHHDRKRKRSKQHSHHRRHRSESPSSHKKKKKHRKRHKHIKTKRKHNVDWNDKDDVDIHNKRQHCQQSSSNNNDQKEREEMRQRRYAREAREMERQRHL